MSDSFKRRFYILQMLKKREDGYITIPEIIKSLKNQGMDAVPRKVERDMKKLALEFINIGFDSSVRPHQWWWDSEETIEIPCMGRNTALTFNLAQQYIEPLFPKASLNYLKPKFKKANQVLSSYHSHKERDWLNKIRVIPHTVERIPAKVSSKVLLQVYEALFEEKVLSIKYNSPAKDKVTKYRIHPIALIYRGITTELIAKDENDGIIKRFVLNRIKEATIQIQSCIIDNYFNLDNFLKTHIGFPASCDQIMFKAWVSWDAKNKIIETPLSKFQNIEETENNAVIVTATVTDTNELVNWILSLGPRIKVLEPNELKNKISSLIKQMAENYS